MKVTPLLALIALVPVAGCAGSDQAASSATFAVAAPKDTPPGQAKGGATSTSGPAPVSSPTPTPTPTPTPVAVSTPTPVPTPAASQSTTPVSAAEWIAMLKAATPGSTIDLGNRPVTFARYTGLSNVTIKGGVFGMIVLDQWKNVTFSGTQFEPRNGDNPAGSLIIAYQPDGLHFDGVTFVGALNAAGQLGFASIGVRGGNNVSVTRSNFHDIGNYLSFLRTTNVQVTDNTFTNIREGLDLVGVANAVVARNTFGPFRPAPGDHSDGIQLFTAGLTLATDHGAQNVLIEDNLVDPGAGYRAQGIFMRDEAALAALGRGYSNITIRNNAMIGTGWHGIAAMDPVQNLLIEGNRLLIRLGTDGVTDNWILIKSGGGTVRNNYAGSINLTAATVASGNTSVKRAATTTEISTADTWVAQLMQAAAAQ
ncbi:MULTISPECIES: right-handed parallel beta-helix repeat-containing protein [unclassified Sphingomonas]|uniref:right-handed parallel beta-helix repeat-containing protein n=1 Tax=unclassified Sphingomonas TaxID=196159 RepID=UPI00092C3496|nr:MULTISPECIES: right-handed parallel beta-helix repeat-containing protein [unclassified Sphingomonas]MBN8848190.1 right-handed parallel beta-helix repeat-containing protein [Sphingomonas sp.]OJV30681.1 MAG: hypothetical protein BGO24_08175 [Sphingomonas sp. 67-36]